VAILLPVEMMAPQAWQNQLPSGAMQHPKRLECFSLNLPVMVAMNWNNSVQ
jgi:hypothetical protein